MRPIVVLNSRKWIDSKVPLLTLLKMVDVMTSYMIEVATIPGIVETWHTIIDIKGLSIWEMPFSDAGMIAVHLKETNFVRAATLHFTNVPRIAEMLAKIIYNFIDDFDKKKMLFWGANFKQPFDELFGLHNMEKKFYGKLPNRKQDFWPPMLNTEELT